VKVPYCTYLPFEVTGQFCSSGASMIAYQLRDFNCLFSIVERGGLGLPKYN